MTTLAAPLDPTVIARGPVATAREILVVTRRNLRRIGRTRRLLYVASIQPITFLLLFRYVFGGAVDTPGMSYANYLVPGIFLQATLFGSTTAVALATDLSGGLVDRFRSLPIARSAVLVARTLADLSRSLFAVLLVTGVGFLVGFRFNNGVAGALGALGLVLVFAYAYSWFLVIIGLGARDAETAQLVSTLPVLILLFASSLAVPVDTMPGWLQPFARNQPVSVTVDAVRALTQGGPIWHSAWQSLAWSAAIVATCVPLAVSRYRRRNR
jgi:ABC transporter DrrB family efflux protein